MADYINRADVLQLCRDGKLLSPNAFEKRALKYIADIPSADVQPVVHGRWKGKKEYFGELHVPIYVWQCTACEGITPVNVDRYKYCPNCGAKMDGDKNV